MRLTDRLKESSYLWVMYTLIGSLLAGVIGMAIYLFVIGILTFYWMQNEILTALTQGYVKYIFISIAELVFIILVVKGLLTETGDTVLIDIIKHGGRTRGCEQLGSALVCVELSDIVVSTQANREIAVDSLSQLIGLNSAEHGYIKFNGGVNDICFVSDLVIDVSDKEKSNYLLEINRYRYSGKKLLGKQEFNVFRLRDLLEDSVGEDCSVVKKECDLEKNTYINRLYNAKVYDYPISFKSDMKDGLKSSKISLGIIAICCFLLIGIYGWYQNFSTMAFINNFESVGYVDGIEIWTDSELYEDYKPFITDSLWMLPDELREEFKSLGWQVAFAQNELYTYETVKNTVGLGEVSGCTLPFYKLIVIKVPNDTKEVSKLFLMETVIHEFGHFLSLKGSGLTEEWRDIYDADRINYLTDYARSGLSEGFACSYAYYKLYPDLLKSNTPKTYEFIERIETNYIKNHRVD